MNWFEDIGINLVRGTNIVIFLAILLSGFVIGVGADKGVIGIAFSMLGALLVGGLITGMVSMACQIHENTVEQTKLLKEILEQSKRQ